MLDGSRFVCYNVSRLNIKAFQVRFVRIREE